MRFNKFLIISLTLTAFLAGYVFLNGKTGLNPGLRTGTVLDKFDGQQEEVAAEEVSEDNTIPFLLADRKVVSVTNYKDNGTIRYFEKATGKMFEVNPENKTEQAVSETVLPNFISSLWSPLKNEVISYFNSPSGQKIKYHNYNDGRTMDLDQNIKSVAFSPDGGLLAYFYYNNAASQSEPAEIGISQPDGTYKKKVISTRINDLTLAWPDREKIAFKTLNSEIFLLSEEGSLTKLVESRPNLEEKWSLSGKKVLLSALNNNTSLPELWVRDLETKQDVIIPVNGTASKCAWSLDDSHIYCAIPKSTSIDEVYRVNIADGSLFLVAEPNTLVSNLLLSALEDYLVFIGVNDERLYGVKLPKD